MPLAVQVDGSFVTVHSSTKDFSIDLFLLMNGDAGGRVDEGVVEITAAVNASSDIVVWVAVVRDEDAAIVVTLQFNLIGVNRVHRGSKLSAIHSEESLVVVDRSSGNLLRDRARWDFLAGGEVRNWVITEATTDVRDGEVLAIEAVMGGCREVLAATEPTELILFFIRLIPCVNFIKIVVVIGIVAALELLSDGLFLSLATRENASALGYHIRCVGELLTEEDLSVSFFTNIAFSIATFASQTVGGIVDSDGALGDGLHVRKGGIDVEVDSVALVMDQITNARDVLVHEAGALLE